MNQVGTEFNGVFIDRCSSIAKRNIGEVSKVICFLPKLSAAKTINDPFCLCQRIAVLRRFKGIQCVLPHLQPGHG